jgi:hypothetical protein
MKGLRFSGRIMLVLPLLILFACSLITLADAQSVPQFPARSNPLSLPGNTAGSDALPVSSGMLAPFLPKIPNLEFGFLYSFGNNARTGRFTADYVLPFNLGCNSVLFGEAHAEGWDFWKKPNVSITTPAGFTTTTSTSRSRVDLSFGGGYRTMLGDGMMLGANGFYDTSRVFNKWYSSGGVGLEMAATVGGDDAVDVNFNWYGNLFNRDVLVNAFRNKGNSFDVEAGYSHALFDHALDLRLKFAGYQFDVGSPVYGWRGGADLTTKNGMFTLRYEHGRDRIDGDYNTVGGIVNVGFQLENLLAGESPFTMPEPVFRSPRNLSRLLGLKVKRNWHQQEAVVVRRSSRASGSASDCLPIVMTIANTVLLPFNVTIFLPWDGGGTISPECLSQVSRIEYTGYTVNFVGVGVSQISVRLAENSSVSSGSDFLYDLGPIPPPVVNTTAATALAGLGASANGVILVGGGVSGAFQISNLVVTFYP